MGRIITALICFVMVGCITPSTITPISVDPIVEEVEIPATPPEPEWVNLTRKPVIRTVENGHILNYEVSDEFMELSLQHKDYIKRIQEWKKKNLIP